MTIRLVVYGILAALLGWLIVRQHSSLATALQAARDANLSWLLLAVVALALSLPATALVYMALSPKPLLFRRTVLVQTAGFCINKLLPSGSGAAGTSFLYLRANGVPGIQAGAVVLLNNLLGFVGHFLVFALLLALQPDTLHVISEHGGIHAPGLLVLAGTGLVLLAATVILRKRATKILPQIMSVVSRRMAIVKALGASTLITLSYVVCLWASTRAVGSSITLSMAIVALSVSVLATSVVPAPGGIGVAEIGAYSGLVLVGVDNTAALAAALLYRVCSFWLPLLIGSLAFVVVTRRGYLRKAR